MLKTRFIGLLAGIIIMMIAAAAAFGVNLPGDRANAQVTLPQTLPYHCSFGDLTILEPRHGVESPIGTTNYPDPDWWSFFLAGVYRAEDSGLVGGDYQPSPGHYYYQGDGQGNIFGQYHKLIDTPVYVVYWFWQPSTYSWIYRYGVGQTGNYFC